MSEKKEARTEPESFPVTVRTTMQPDRDLQVERADWIDLYRQGILQPGYDGLSSPSK